MPALPRPTPVSGMPNLWRSCPFKASFPAGRAPVHTWETVSDTVRPNQALGYRTRSVSFCNCGGGRPESRRPHHQNERTIFDSRRSLAVY